MGLWTTQIRVGDDIPWFRRQNKVGLGTIEIVFGGDIP